MIDPLDILPNGGIELRERETRGCDGFAMAEIPWKFGKAFRIQRPEEPFNLPAALRSADSGIDQLEMQVCRDLLEMGAGEITTMIDVMWPFVLCGLTARWSVLSEWGSSVWPHNAYRDWSHWRSDGSSRQMGFPRHASEVSVDRSHAWSASAFIRSVISA